MNPIRVLIADDHAVVAEALGSLLKEQYILIGTVNDGATLVQKARKEKADIIIADLEMPHLTGLDALRQLRTEKIDSRFIFLTVHSEPHLVREALKAGASAYLLKDSAGEEVFHAIDEVLKGNVYITPGLMKNLVNELNNSSQDSTPKLTIRQRQVLRLVCKGQTAKEIASTLNISARTVETYKYEAMQTLGAKTTAELISYSIRKGLDV